jgi:hypothetical protein
VLGKDTKTGSSFTWALGEGAQAIEAVTPRLGMTLLRRGNAAKNVQGSTIGLHVAVQGRRRRGSSIRVKSLI